MQYDQHTALHDNNLPWYRKLGNLAHEYAARAGETKDEICVDAAQVHDESFVGGAGLSESASAVHA